MSLTNTALADAASGSREVFDDNVNATAQTSIATGTKKIISLELDNTLNASAVFVKLFDQASPVVGTSIPDWVIKVGAGDKVTLHSFSSDRAFEFATAISWCAVTVGGTGGTTAPTSAFKVRAIYIS